MLHSDQASNSFWDIGLQSACPVQIVIAHARYHATYTPYTKFGYIFEFPTPTLPIHYDTFIELRWRIRGCLLVKPPMLKAKSSENCPHQNWANFGGFGGLRVRSFKKLWFLPQKAHLCVNPRRLSHFAPKSVEGCDLQVGSEKKVRKSRTPIGKTCRR